MGTFLVGAADSEKHEITIEKASHASVEPGCMTGVGFFGSLQGMSGIERLTGLKSLEIVLDYNGIGAGAHYIGEALSQLPLTNLTLSISDSFKVMFKF